MTMARMFESNAHEIKGFFENMKRHLTKHRGAMYDAVDAIGQDISSRLANYYRGTRPPRIPPKGTVEPGTDYIRAPMHYVVNAASKRTGVASLPGGWVVGVVSLADLFNQRFYIERRFDHATYNQGTWTLPGSRYSTPAPGVYLWWTFVEYGVNNPKKAYWAQYSLRSKATGTLTLRYPILFGGTTLHKGMKFDTKGSKQFSHRSGKHYFRTVETLAIQSGGIIDKYMREAFIRLSQPI